MGSPLMTWMLPSIEPGCSYKINKDKLRVMLAPFRRLSRFERRAVAEEVESLARFLGVRSAQLAN